MDRAISETFLLSETGGAEGGSVFLNAVLILSLVMLVWNTIEVGRNDAANIVNAVFGSRVLTRVWAVRIAGIGVVLGATMGKGVVEMARKGIFDPEAFSNIEAAVSVYLSVYIVNAILLYAYSSFGMPVSTTACLVFSLLGAAVSMEWLGAVRWGNAGRVVAGHMKVL